MQSLVALMGGVLADGTDESLGATGRIDADEVEDLALVQVTLRATQVTHPQLLDLIRLDTHE